MSEPDDGIFAMQPFTVNDNKGEFSWTVGGFEPLILPAGDYKFYASLSTKTVEGYDVKFTPVTKPVVLTVKVVAQKTPNMTVPTSYTLDKEVDAKMKIEPANITNLDDVDIRVLNENKNGTLNRFTDFFEIQELNDGAYLVCKKTEGITDADLTGYFELSMTNASMYPKRVIKNVKVTVTFVEAEEPPVPPVP